MMVKYNFNTTPERSYIMRRIKGKNTSPELLFRKKLWSFGFRYRVNVSKVQGNPDVYIQKYKVAVFIDGEFWHGFNWEKKKERIKSNRDYWIPKIERNIKRDHMNTKLLEAEGIKVFRFWGREIKKDLDRCVNDVVAYIESHQNGKE